MPKYSNRTDLGIKKQKPFTGNTKKLMDFTNEYILPKTPADVVTSWGAGKLLGFGFKGAKAGVKKVIKANTKTKKVTKTTKKK
jgi:hypothetical protein